MLVAWAEMLRRETLFGYEAGNGTRERKAALLLTERLSEHLSPVCGALGPRSTRLASPGVSLPIVSLLLESSLEIGRLRFTGWCLLLHWQVHWPRHRKESSIEKYKTINKVPLKMAKIWDTDTIKCCRGCGARGTLLHRWWESKMARPRWKTLWKFLTKLHILLPYDPATALLVYMQRSWKSMSTQTHAHWSFSSFIHNCKNLKATKIAFRRSMGVTQPSKEMEHRGMKRCGGNFDACCWVKEDSLKRLHATWLQLCDVLENFPTSPFFRVQFTGVKHVHVVM